MLRLRARTEEPLHGAQRVRDDRRAATPRPTQRAREPRERVPRGTGAGEVLRRGYEAPVGAQRGEEGAGGNGEEGRPDAEAGRDGGVVAGCDEHAHRTHTCERDARIYV